MIDLVRREIARAMAGCRSAFRAVLASTTLDTRVQRGTGEGLASESLQDMELFQQFGFTSGLPPGTQLIVLPLGGRTSSAVVVATEHGAYRFHVDAAGEAAMYSQWGDLVHIRKDRSIHVKADALVEVESPESTFSGNVSIAGNLSVQGTSTLVGNVATGADVAIAGSLAVAGPSMTHDGTDIGHDHTHSGVATGPHDTGPPR